MWNCFSLAGAAAGGVDLPQVAERAGTTGALGEQHWLFAHPSQLRPGDAGISSQESDVC